MVNRRKALNSSRFSGVYLFFIFIINATASTWLELMELVSESGILTRRTRKYINQLFLIFEKPRYGGTCRLIPRLRNPYISTLFFKYYVSNLRMAIVIPNRYKTVNITLLFLASHFGRNISNPISLLLSYFLFCDSC